MENSEIVYSGELFVKVNPIDVSKEVEDAKKELPILRKEFYKAKGEIQKKEFTSMEDLQKLKEDFEYMRSVEEVTKMPPFISYGMDRFWTLSIQEDSFMLLTNRQNEFDDMIVSKFHSLDEIKKYYRSLADIIHKEQFIGKQIQTDHYQKNNDDFVVYGLFELNNIVISCTLDERNKLKNIYSGVKSIPKPINYVGESISELNDPGEILRLVYKQRI